MPTAMVLPQGGTGSVVSKAVNNTKLYGQIDILGDQSELHGKDIYVSASALRRERSAVPEGSEVPCRDCDRIREADGGAYYHDD